MKSLSSEQKIENCIDRNYRETEKTTLNYFQELYMFNLLLFMLIANINLFFSELQFIKF